MGKLHQRKNSFLHARPSGGGEHDERRILVDRRLQALDHGLAGGHAERTAHEIEILHADDHRQTFELAEPELDGVPGSGLAARVLEAIGVAALVTKFQRIERHSAIAMSIQVWLSKIDFRRCDRAHAHVIIGAGNDELVRLDVLVEDELARSPDI